MARLEKQRKERGTGLRKEERTEAQQQARDEDNERQRKRFGYGLDDWSEEQQARRDEVNQAKREEYESVHLSTMSKDDREAFYDANPGHAKLVIDMRPDEYIRHQWRQRRQELYQLAQKQYLETPLFYYLRVDPAKLLEGSQPEAELLRKLVQLVESGEYEIITGDLEGQGALAHEFGVVSMDQDGKVKVLVNEDNNDLPKNIATGMKGRRSHRRPALVSNKLYKLLEKMRTVTDMASGENVMCFHYGGRERELLKALGIPDGLFHDALRIIRYILGAKMNGQFPPNGLSFFLMLFFESPQTHTGVDDSDFTCWLLQAFVEALIRRRDGEKKIEFGQPPSREWDRGDGPAPKRRRRPEEFPGVEAVLAAAEASKPWSKAP